MTAKELTISQKPLTLDSKDYLESYDGMIFDIASEDSVTYALEKEFC